MGASTSTNSSTSSFTPRKTRVLLKLNSVRGVQLGPNEEFYGVVGVGQPLDIALVRQESPVEFVVSDDMVLTLEFRTAFGDSSSVRNIGEIRVPLKHMSQRCGRSLYRMWFPLNSQWPKSQGSSDSQALQNGIHELYDHSMRIAARDPRLPLVCISLCSTDLPEAAQECYQRSASQSAKNFCFNGLMVSHSQHVRLLQSLYKHSRSGKNVAPGLESTQSWAHEDREQVARLRQEIDMTTSEANSRIDQACEAIKTLKERLNARQADHERFRQGTIQCAHDTAALEIENERLALKIERQAREAVVLRKHQEEARQLRRDKDVLHEQKEALVLILEDLYGGTRMDDSTRRKHTTLEPEENGVEGWTNMLPPPSDLMLESRSLEQAVGY